MTNISGKVVLVGPSGSGKTSLVTRYVQGTFMATQPTIGSAFWTKRIFSDQEKLTLQIWDTAGQERFASMNPMYYRGASAAVLVFDITSTLSFDQAVTWAQEIAKHADQEISIKIAANKSDLMEHRQVSDEKITQFAQNIGANFFLTSAKKNTGVEELFAEIAFELFQKEGKKVEPTFPPEKDEGCGC